MVYALWLSTLQPYTTLTQSPQQAWDSSPWMESISKIFVPYSRPFFGSVFHRECFKCNLLCSREGMSVLLLGMHSCMHSHPSVPELIHEFHRDCTDGILLTSWWPHQPWFTVLLYSAEDNFIRLFLGQPTLSSQENDSVPKCVYSELYSMENSLLQEIETPRNQQPKKVLYTVMELIHMLFVWPREWSAYIFPFPFLWNT